MVDDRSQAITSQQSQRISTHMTGMGDAADRQVIFNLYVVKPEQVQDLWDAEDPNAQMQALLKDHIEEVREQLGQDWRCWDENEDRFEPNELKWISNFLVSTLAFAKSELALDNVDAVAHLIQVFWKTLDLLNENPPSDLRAATASRYEMLQGGIKRIFEQGLLTRDQIKAVLAYAKKTIFAHLQLYLACMQMKKQAERTKRFDIPFQHPVAATIGDLESECTEIIEARPEEVSPEGMDGLGEGMEGEGAEEEDPVDPNDPLFGLEERLSQLDLDEESINVLKTKLQEASSRIKEGLEKRQMDLDSKLAQMTGTKKR